MHDAPLISIVIPNRNQAPRLRLLLHALQNQDFDYPIEIILVDNGSSDDSVSVANELNITVTSVTKVHNPYIARNQGMKQARGEFILLLDSTCIPSSEFFLQALYTCYTDENAGLIVGNIEFDLGEKPTIGEIADALLFIPNSEGGDSRTDFPAGVLFFKRELLQDVGYFREDMRSGADVDWTRKVTASGQNVKYCKHARVLYSPKRLNALLRKAYRIGKGHRVLLKETYSFDALSEALRMRPPSPGYLNTIINTRGRNEFHSRKIGLIVVIWLYRISLGMGRIFG